MVNPPMLADVQLKNQPMSLLPGGTTYVSGLGRDREGARPIYTVMPPIAEMMQESERSSNALRLRFTTICSRALQTYKPCGRRPRSTRAAKRSSYCWGLCSSASCFNREGLGAAIDRVWGIMYRGQLLPPAPEKLRSHRNAYRG